MLAIRAAAVQFMASAMLSSAPQVSGIMDDFFQKAPDLLAVVDSTGHGQFLNPAWSHWSGFALSELRDRALVSFVHPEDRTALVSRLAVNDQPFCLNLRFQRRSGDYAWLRWNAAPDAAQKAFFVTAADVTAYMAAPRTGVERAGAVAGGEMSDQMRLLVHEKELLLHKFKECQRNFKRQSREDELTGLFNRRYICTRLRYEFLRSSRYERPLAIAICRIDNLDEINAQLTHRAGDDTIVKTGCLLRAAVRSIDAVGRFAQSEFALIFPETSLLHAVSISDKLRAVIDGFDWSSIAAGLKVRLVIGMAENVRMRSIDDMLSEAEIQLFRARSLQSRPAS